MLMQTDPTTYAPDDGTPIPGKIYLLPAWPKDWDCEFKLHAPQQTTVEGKVVKGKVVDLKVTPESRRKDIVIMGG
jgi:hypothetical protein